MTARPSDLRQQYLRGELDKHEYARRISEHHLTLSDLSSMLVGSDIARIELSPTGVTFVSRFGGARFPCDPADRGLPPVVALNFGSYEAKDFAMLLALVPRGATFVDVGANIGWYSIHVAVADPTARAIAIEPIPSSFRWLSTAVTENALPNVSAVNAAIGAERGTLTLFVDATLSGAASAAPSTGESGLDQIHCPVVTIDELVAEHGSTVDVLKLDIEGGELYALRGASRVLTTQRPIVFCEMLRKLARPFGYHPNEIISLMAGHGYRCYRAEASRLIPFGVMDEDTLETNFYFLHHDAHTRERARFAVPA
jgi:FkbM family methyltransferase